MTLNLGIEHSREHLTAYRRALALDGFPEPTERDRAEGLRNACVWAAIFGGPATTWPGERYFVCDLHRKLISAGAAGCDLATDARLGQRSSTRPRCIASWSSDDRRRRHQRAASRAAAGRRAGSKPRSHRLRSTAALLAVRRCVRRARLQVRLALLEAAIAAALAPTRPQPRSASSISSARRLTDGEHATLEALGFAGSADATAAALSGVARAHARTGEPLEPAEVRDLAPRSPSSTSRFERSNGSIVTASRLPLRFEVQVPTMRPSTVIAGRMIPPPGRSACSCSGRWRTPRST